MQFVLHLLIFTLVQAWGFNLGSRPVGSEFEYALHESSVHKKDQEGAYKELLGFVREQFGGGPIKILPWNKYLNAQNTVYGVFEDSLGRRWMAVPELMNNDSFEGIELVTPPLASAEDIRRMQEVLYQIEKSGNFVEGRRSSTHYTTDIGDLIKFDEANSADINDPIDGDENISEVVDLILFLEMHVVEIYNIIQPQRYGHIMNTYAIPLSLNQKTLLRRLAETPPKMRTYRYIRDIFQSFDPLELLLVNNDRVSAWKFRLFNYAKFFKLGIFSERIDAIEMRIADLSDHEAYPRTREIIERLIDVGHREPITYFVDPFPNIDHFDKTEAGQTAMDSFIKLVSPEKYEAFLKKLGLPLDEYPPFGSSPENQVVTFESRSDENITSSLPAPSSQRSSNRLCEFFLRAVGL